MARHKENASVSAAAETKNAPPVIDLHAPELYLNRELGWLEFNRRVMHEAEDERTPLLERVKFLAIVSGNLDEFFMKRLGGLKKQHVAGIHLLTVDGRTPRQQIEESHAVIREMERRKQEILGAVRALLQEAGIAIVSHESLTSRERKRLRDKFLADIYPLITPQAIDPAHPFPLSVRTSFFMGTAPRSPPSPSPTATTLSSSP